MKKLSLSFFTFYCMFSFAQNADNTLFTYKGNPVTVQEFDQVYKKNNVNNQADYSEKSIRDYLELYINFKLKTAEAKDRQLDTIKSLKTELEGYRKQLSQAYLTDRVLLDMLCKEGYDRSKKDLKVSHILVRVEAGKTDTVAALKKINEAAKLAAKKNFNEVAVQFSEDPSVQKNKGNLGYITAFQTVYPFENMAYNTPVGKVSPVFKTKFGYHILKVEAERPDPGKIRAAHLLIRLKDSATAAEQQAVKQKIDSIYNLINSKQLTFEDAVKQFSDDKFTAVKNGELPEFGSGRMVPEFEEAAFALTKDGEFSTPFKTHYGWHIVKRISKTENANKTYDEMKRDIKQQVEKDERNALTKQSFYDKAKKRYGFSESKENVDGLYKMIPDSVYSTYLIDWKIEKKPTDKLFSLGSTTYTQDQFIDYLNANFRKNWVQNNRLATFNNTYKAFTEQKLTEMEEKNLDANYPDFKSLMQEYTNGVLIFDLMDKEVWTKAVKDSVGLASFYEKNKNKYLWGNRIQVEIYNCTDAALGKEVEKLLASNAPSEKITEKLNKKDSNKKVSVIKGKFEKNQYELLNDVAWEKGKIVSKTNSDNSVSVIKVVDVVNPEPKDLVDVKGYMVSDYQNYLEKEWIQYLRNKYPVQVNEASVKQLIK